MYSGLCQHAVVFELTLPQWWGVAGDDDELGLARAQSLQGALVAQSDLARLLLWVRIVISTCACAPSTAHLDSQRQLGVDAVSALAALLWCHCDGLWCPLVVWKRLSTGWMNDLLESNEGRICGVCLAKSCNCALGPCPTC